MKKLAFVTAALLSMTLCAGNAMADHDPVMCTVEINYNGHEYGGHDDGINEMDAKMGAKEEACDRACRKDGDDCEHNCMRRAFVRSEKCVENPRAKRGKDFRDDVLCRVSVSYKGDRYDGSDSDKNVNKAVDSAKEEACDAACHNDKRCERDCRVRADVVMAECTDRNDHVVHKVGTVPPKPGMGPQGAPVPPPPGPKPGPGVHGAPVPPPHPAPAPQPKPGPKPKPGKGKH